MARALKWAAMTQSSLACSGPPSLFLEGQLRYTDEAGWTTYLPPTACGGTTTQNGSYRVGMEWDDAHASSVPPALWLLAFARWGTPYDCGLRVRIVHAYISEHFYGPKP